MAEKRYVRLALAESAAEEVRIAAKQFEILKGGLDDNATPDLRLLALRSENQLATAKQKAALVMLPAVEVRVLTMHTDDDAARKIKAQSDLLSEFHDNQVDALTGRGVVDSDGKAAPARKSDMTPDAALKLCDTIAEVGLRMEGLRRELLRSVLSDKQSGDQIEEMIRTCTPTELSLVLLAASRPDLLPTFCVVQSAALLTSVSEPIAA